MLGLSRKGIWQMNGNCYFCDRPAEAKTINGLDICIECLFESPEYDQMCDENACLKPTEVIRDEAE